MSDNNYPSETKYRLNKYRNDLRNVIKKYPIPMALLGILGILLLLSLIIWGFVSLAVAKPVKPDFNTVEAYIKDANDSMNLLKNKSEELEKFAKDFFDTRTNYESNVSVMLEADAKTALEDVEKIRDECLVTYNNTETLVDNNTGLVTAMQTSATNSATSLQAIQDIINNGSQTASNDASNFGRGLFTIENNKNTIYNSISSSQNNVNQIKIKYGNAQENQQKIYNKLQDANKTLDNLRQYFDFLISEIMKSTAYAGLQDAITKATNTKAQLDKIVSSFNNELSSGNLTSANITAIRNVITNLENSINESSQYLTDLIDIFNAAGATNDVKISGYIGQINDLFVIIAATIGSVRYTTPSSGTKYPIATVTPALASGKLSIITIYTNTCSVVTEIETQYNAAIGYYNTVVGHVNNLNSFATLINNALESPANAVNSSIKSIQGTLLSFFEGGTTPIPERPDIQTIQAPSVPNMSTPSPYSCPPIY